ncbi:MAG TPA: hydrolase [Alphaproteobacteria bacterium]|nr:hydrolase [Alphaproteobacteria bacterium]
MKINNQDILKLKPVAVIFDLDNTLYDYERAHNASIKAVCNKVIKKLNLTEAQFYQAFKEAKKQIKETLGETASSHSRLLYFQRMLEIIGLRSQVLMALEFEQTYWNTFLNTAEIYHDAKEFLDDLRIAGIQTALLTDLTAQIQFRKISYWGLDRYFDNIVTSEEAGTEKPHRKGFELVMKKLGNPVGQGVIWMVGDNLEKDIAGAKTALNCYTILKQTNANYNSSQIVPDAEFNEFMDIRACLKSFC